MASKKTRNAAALLIQEAVLFLVVTLAVIAKANVGPDGRLRPPLRLGREVPTLLARGTRRDRSSHRPLRISRPSASHGLGGFNDTKGGPA